MKPIFLICGCIKYRNSLEYAIKRFSRPSWITVGCVGDPALELPYYDISQNIVHLPVGDTYEQLPQKMWQAFHWIMTTWPDTPGVFKTDEDIWFTDMNELERTITNNTAILYWGLHRSKINAGVVGVPRVTSRFTDTTLRPQYQAADYCWGAGYWIGNAAFKIINDSREEYYTSCLEDVTMGSVLNKGGVFPTQIALKWCEKPRIC